MIRQRVRIRFSKSGDLRLISHRDLVRVWERLFRRAALALSMSEGFHPKARLSFPSALGLGIEGNNEVMEVELGEATTAEQLQQRLEPLCPPGLQILAVEAPEAGVAKAAVLSMTYEIAVPVDRRPATAEAIRQLMAAPQMLIERPGRREPIDLRESLDELTLEGGVLRMRLLASRQASVRPREVLTAIGLGDLEQLGAHLRRSAVELKP